MRYDGQEKGVTTILEDPRSILEESGVKVGKEDRILISPANAEKKTREVIELKRALPVTIEKYGVSKKFYTGKATVGEALDALAINYEGKTVYPAVDTPITSDPVSYTHLASGRQGNRAFPYYHLADHADGYG